MSSAAFRALLFKDRHFILPMVLSYLGAGLCAITLNLIRGEAIIIVNSFFILTIFMSFYSHLAMKATLGEIRDRNYFFLVTLPLSSRFLFFSKLAVNWLAFLLLWSAFLVALAITILTSSHIPSMVFSLYVMIFALYPPVFSIILAVGMISRSEGGTILSFVLCNSISTALISLISNTEQVQSGFPKGTFYEIGWTWPSWAGSLALVSFAITLIASLATVTYGARRREFF